MPQQSTQRSRRLDRVFHALADPTRRAVLHRLGRGPAPVTELARPFRMALPSFAQHLDVLERCGLVRSRKAGRVRTYRLSPRPLVAAEQWMAHQRALWGRRLDQLDRILPELKEPKRATRSPAREAAARPSRPARGRSTTGAAPTDR